MQGRAGEVGERSKLVYFFFPYNEISFAQVRLFICQNAS